MKSVWEQYQGRPVRIIAGPFTGWEGQACGTYGDKIEVAFPNPQQPRLWFLVKDVSLETKEA